jgi:SlyX protein
MDTMHTTDKRLTDLEIKASYAEDLLDQLNLVIVRQQEDIALLVREVSLLKQQAMERGADLAPRPMDELPPHY